MNHPASTHRTAMPTHAATPLLSVVIPTCKRPHFLPLAIDSALRAAPDGDVEVLVVPNGPDASWQDVAARYADEPRVHWHPVATANANVARNHGLRLARGAYIRFLDDDDALLPEGARLQLQRIQAAAAELCSGSVDVVDGNGAFVRHMAHADTHDLFVAMVREGRICLPVSHLFLRTALDGFRWNEALAAEQDTDWMLRLASQREWRWLPLDDVVGTWTWHAEQRTSASISHVARARSTARMLASALASLEHRGQLDASRKTALVETLWQLAHNGFRHDRAPLFWSRIARIARREMPASRPPDARYDRPVLRALNPIVIEWLMLPKQRFKDWRRARKQRHAEAAL